MKGFILSRLAEAGETGLWDYEIMQMVFDEYNRSGAYWKGEIRATLTDLFSCALVLEVMDDLDDGWPVLWRGKDTDEIPAQPIWRGPYGANTTWRKHDLAETGGIGNVGVLGF